MERVAFLIEETNERLSCLLNPENVVMRRTAGVKPRETEGGQINAAGLDDAPLVSTGGGRTEIEMDLLFDIELAGSSIRTQDVRDLTRPFWDMTRTSTSRTGQLPIVRFIWGKYWNIPGVVVSVAERLEDFMPNGAARRSWLRLKMVRVEENAFALATAARSAAAPIPPDFFNHNGVTEALSNAASSVTEEEARYHEVLAGDRLDTLAMLYYKDPKYWRMLARVNNIRDPNRLTPGTVLLVPAPSFFARLIAGFKRLVGRK